MSTIPSEQAPVQGYGDPAPSEIGAVADQLVALVEEFEAELSNCRVPPVFAERLSQLRETADRLIDPEGTSFFHPKQS